MMGQIQYISDENNEVTAVIVPIELWRELMSEKKAAYLLKSEAMKKRLLEAKHRKEGIPFEKASEELGIPPTYDTCSDESEKISKQIERLYAQYPVIKPFKEIDDPQQWQRNIRDEWS